MLDSPFLRGLPEPWLRRLDEAAAHETLYAGEPLGRGRLDGRRFAGPAAILGTMRHDHPVLGWDHVETLGSVLPDDVHHAMTARTDRTLGSERDVDARKMSRQ